MWRKKGKHCVIFLHDHLVAVGFDKHEDSYAEDGVTCLAARKKVWLPVPPQVGVTYYEIEGGKGWYNRVQGVSYHLTTGEWHARSIYDGREKYPLRTIEEIREKKESFVKGMGWDSCAELPPDQVICDLEDMAREGLFGQPGLW